MKSYNPCNHCENKMCEICEYRKIEKELFSLKKKQMPKKPITYKETNRANCAVCGATVRGINKPFGDWCAKCGQKVDWDYVYNIES